MRKKDCIKIARGLSIRHGSGLALGGHMNSCALYHFTQVLLI